MNLHPQDASVASKVEDFDEPAVVDQDQFLVLGVGVKTIKRNRPQDGLPLEFSHADLSKAFGAAVTRVGLEVLAPLASCATADHLTIER